MQQMKQTVTCFLCSVVLAVFWYWHLVQYCSWRMRSPPLCGIDHWKVLSWCTVESALTRSISKAVEKYHREPGFLGLKSLMIRYHSPPETFEPKSPWLKFSNTAVGSKIISSIVILRHMAPNKKAGFGGEKAMLSLWWKSPENFNTEKACLF